MWTLAPGPDGTRTVYGQLKYASGAWSPVGSVSVELDQSPATSMYADIDQSPVFDDASTGSPAPDWHERSSTPTDPVYGYGISFPSPDPFGFAVADGHWSFSFIRHDGAIEPGSYQTQPLVGDQCVTTCATVSLNAGRDCPGTGTVQIDEIAFTPDGDLESVAADFRLDCHVYGVMSGSIRYGTDRPMQALDQSAETYRLVSSWWVPAVRRRRSRSPTSAIRRWSLELRASVVRRRAITPSSTIRVPVRRWPSTSRATSGSASRPRRTGTASPRSRSRMRRRVARDESG